MIYYYFGDKEGLYLSALENAYQTVRQGEGQLDIEHLPPLEALKKLVDLFKGKGLQIYTPDVDAFRKFAQEKYLASDLAKDWPAGMVDKINAL